MRGSVVQRAKRGLLGQVASAVATALEVVSGDAQSATVSQALGAPLVVRVLDQFGSPFAGRTVSAAVNSGGGSITPASAVTNASGLASFTATVGSVAGFNSFTATSAGLTGSPLVFTATGVAGSTTLAGPNAPAGYTQLVNTPWDATSIPNFPAENSEGWGNNIIGTVNPADTTLVASGAGDKAVRFTFQTSLPFGEAPTFLVRPSAAWGSNIRKLYVCDQVRFDPNFLITNGTQKWLFCRTPGGENHYVGFNSFAGNDTAAVSLGVQGPNPTTRTTGSTVDVLDGAYHTLEWLLELEAVPGTTTGRITIWVDGVQRYFASDIQYLSSGSTSTFVNINYVPTYGGAGGSPPTPMFMESRGLFVSGSA